MNANASLKRIQIKGLYGTSKCIDVELENNTLILVGENGSGKTTFLRILFNLLAERWQELSKFSFNSAILTFNDGKDIEIPHSDLSRLAHSGSSSLGRSETRDQLGLIDALEISKFTLNNEQIEALFNQMIDAIKSYYGLSKVVFPQKAYELDEPDEPLKVKNNSIIKKINAQVLYLPTYRRIERELDSVVEGIDSSNLPSPNRSIKPSNDEAYIELVEFGMQDVEDTIKNELDKLKEFQIKNLNELTLRPFGDIVSSAYQREDSQRLADLSEEEIESVLKRVDESIVGKEQRKEWLQAIKDAKSTDEPSDRDKIICHYFLEILDFQKSLQSKEKNISKFCEVCSSYMTDKEFVYDNTSFDFFIRPNFDCAGDSIQLSDLSSGEKQIVSLFSHLYLSGKSHYFVLIDEPELSLSVLWQKQFLVDIHKSDFCVGLVAVTHSPFIYNNELRPYARSMGEFISL
ncbi:MAG: AAA family ATPase [Oscillatoria sp. SIO1A7]|nr:AAA family ATPase [Oscillatoria sp. SIO1A7]